MVLPGMNVCSAKGQGGAHGASAGGSAATRSCLGQPARGDGSGQSISMGAAESCGAGAGGESEPPLLVGTALLPMAAGRPSQPGGGGTR